MVVLEYICFLFESSLLLESICSSYWQNSKENLEEIYMYIKVEKVTELTYKIAIQVSKLKLLQEMYWNNKI